MKYCKKLEAEQHPSIRGLRRALQNVQRLYNGTYRYYARIVANTSRFEVRRENQVHRANNGLQHRNAAVGSISRTTIYTTTWVARSFSVLFAIPIT
jgi:hypothetical protein